MPAAGSLYQPSISLPLNVPDKSPFRPAVAPSTGHARLAGSPTSASSSVNTSAVPSLTSGSYARSTSSDNEVPSAGGAGHGVDLIDMMTDRLGSVVNPLAMDRSLARQAQTSGELNAKQRELAELQAMAQRRMRGTRANFADGAKAAKDVRSDLEWSQKRVSGFNVKAAQKHPAAYKKASQRFPAHADY